MGAIIGFPRNIEGHSGMARKATTKKKSNEDVAKELGVSQPAAGGLLRRGLRRLVLATVAESDQ